MSSLSETLNPIIRISDQCCRPYVLPERYVVPFTESDDMGIMRPRGLLCVQVIEAEDVPRMV